MKIRHKEIYEMVNAKEYKNTFLRRYLFKIKKFSTFVHRNTVPVPINHANHNKSSFVSIPFLYPFQLPTSTLCTSFSITKNPEGCAARKTH